MKKYITTENHPTFRTGIILKVNSGHKISLEDGTIIGISKDGFNCWLSDRWIREIQEPKWTDSDMQNYAIYCYSIPFGSEFTIEEWKKQK